MEYPTVRIARDGTKISQNAPSDVRKMEDSVILKYAVLLTPRKGFGPNNLGAMGIEEFLQLHQSNTFYSSR